MTAPSNGPLAEPEELERLRTEVVQLRGALDTRHRRASQLLAVRKAVAAVLAALAAFGAVASVIGLWGARTTLSTDRWVATVAPLPQNPQVANAVSTYVTDELVRVLDMRDRIAGALPPQAAFLATPMTGAVRDYVQRTVNSVVQTPQFQKVWIGLNQTAHKQIIAVVENRSEIVTTSGDIVTLNLLPVVNNVLVRLEQQAPTLFGKKLNLPEVTSGQVPPGLQNRIESQLGVRLPADFAAIPIYRGDQLGALQDAVRTFKRYLALWVLGTLAALGLALWVSPGRRRTTLQVGVWLVIATVTLTAVLRAVRGQILDNVPAGAYRDGVGAAMTIVFATLRERGLQLLLLGVAIAVIAYLAGPGRGATWVRRQVAAAWHALARGASWIVAETGGRPWIRSHLDPLRIGGVIVAAIVALLLSSWASLFVVLILLAAYEAGLTMLARSGEEPEAVKAKSATVIPPEPVTVALVEPQSGSVVLPAPRTDQAETTD